MSKYSDIKKRVVGQMGSTDNKSGSGYSATGAYYDIKKKIKTQGTKYDIDDEYLDSFYSDAKSFFDDADSDYNNNSYSTAKANNENYKSRWSDLNRRAEYIRSYINSRKNSLDDETYSGMMSYLDQFNNASRQYLSAFRNASNYYSKWKTEDEYNDAVEAQKIREKMLSDDLDAAKKDIDALKAVRDAAEESSNNRRNVTYNDLVSAYTRAGYGINAKAKAKADYEAIQANNSKVDSEIASILEGTGYSTIDELNDAISKKSAYYNQSKRLQDGAALYDEAKSASDFDHYASVGDALSNEKRDGFFATEYDKKNKIGYLRNNPEAMDKFEKGAVRAGSDPLEYTEFKAAKYMTNDEYKVYSSYLGKEDTETAEKYLSYLDDELNQRAANATYKIREGNTLSELIFGVEAGLDQFKSGVKNLFNTNDEYIAPSYIQYASGMVREDLADAGFNIFGSSLGQIGYDLITTTSNMMPSILTSALVGMANPIAGKVVGAGLMGASAAGNAYQEMLNLGYDKGQARTYSTLTGLSEAGLQSILGGIGNLGGVVSGKSIESIAKGINKAAARFAIQFGGEMASEGLEEFLQDILDPFFKSYATKEFLDIPEGYLEQAVYSGMLGALSAGVLNGFDRATNRVMEYGAAQQIKDEGKVNELVKVGKLFSADTVAYKLADKVTDNTGAWKLSKLLHEVNANLSEQNQADIKYNLVRSGMREADADTVTEWLAKAVDGGKFTSLQQKALDENPIISRVFKKVIIDKNSTVNQRIQGMMNINGVEGQAGIDYSAIAKSQSKENLNKSANYYMAVKQAIAEKNKRDLGIGRTTAFDADMNRKASEFATEFAKSNNSLSDNSAVKAVKRDVSEKVSDTNKTTVVSTGEEVSIKKIKSISNGNMELELTNGNTVNSKDIKYKSQDEALVYESVLSMGYSADTANAIVNGYNALTGVSASNYLLGVNEAYNYGRIGYPQESIKSEGFYADLTDAQKRFAYNLGREAADAETKAAQNAIKKGSNNKTGKVHMTSSMSSMTNRQKASVSAIGRVVANVTHNDVYLYESVEKDGKRVFSKDIAGHKAGEKAPNGFYDPNTGAIFIDINAGNGGEGVMLWTAAHELTHFIRQWSPEKFKVLADFLMEEYGKNGVDIQTLIQDQINKAKRSGRKLSFDGAYEEVVADAMQMMFTDTNLSEKIAKLKAKDQTLWQKIKSFFADLYKRITEAYKGLDPQTDEAKFVRSMKDSIEKLSDLFAEAIVDAGEAFSTADATLSENGIAVNPGTESASILSVRDVLDDSNRGKVAKALAWRFGVTEEEALNWLTAETSLASLILNPKYSQYLDYVADPGEVAIKKNLDYPQGTVDFSNICAKRREFTAVMNAILRNFPNHIFAATDLAKIRTIMQEEGMKVPCGICYVEDRRQLDTIVAQDFIKGLELYRKGSKTRPDGKPFNANQLKGLKLTDGDTYVPSVYELVTLEGRNKLKAKNPKMEEAWVKYNNARGMQAVRLLTNEAEYKRQILKYSKDTVKSKNDHGGLRIYSFSDAEMFHLIDIIQVITDSATVGLSLQGYTKVNEYAKAVKDTGEKLNRSLIPKGELGYHMENGKVVLDYDTVEGIDINSKDFFDNKDNPNVGNITIGINDIQIRAAMLSDFVDQIIPFHTGQSDDVLGEKGISTWNNYKDFQTEKDIATGKTSNHQINIYTEVIQALEREGTTINKRSFVEKFLHVCKDNNLTPRFSQFLNTDENGNYVYTEGYHKFLVDFKTFAQTETGEYLPQMPVKPIFDNAYITRILKDYVKTQKAKDAEIAKSMPRVIERITNEIIKPGEKFSDRDSEYLELAKNPKKNEKRLRELVDEAAKKAGYTVEGWHGTGSKKFTKFGYGRNGIFITTDEDIAKTYGSNVMHLYGTENNQIVIDADGHHFTDIPVPEWLRKEIDDYPLLNGKKDTDTLAKVAKNLGYSSIKIANVSDSFSLVSDTHKLSDVYCYFESIDELHFKNSQLKSADLVTYDDNGNIIPLSERFNTKNDDIRYSGRDSIDSEKRILDLENQISDLEEQLADDIFNEINDSDRKKINNKIWKLRHELEVLENAERKATVKTSLADIRDNLDKYRYIDLRSLAEGFGWEDYEDMTKAQLASAMREYLNDIEEEWKDVESSDFYSERDGMWVRPVSDGEKSGAKILSFPSKDMRYSDRYDAKQRYVDRVMSKNAEVETLSDDQHSALRKVAEMRHKFHSNPDGLFNTESASYDMWNYVAQDGEINRLLEQAGLPTIEFGDYTYTPSTFDYEELGGKDEYETLEEWKEQSGVMDEFYKDFNDANERIEKYLRTIDEEHGTQYAPSGFSRLYSDRDPDATDNRTILSNALESAAQKDEEKKLLADYKAQINAINEEQKKLTELRAKIKELSFAKGRRDAEQISKLQAEATKTANLISKFDKQLLKLEASKPLKDVIDRERTLAKKKAEKAGKEALSAYREKAVQTQRELMNRYQARIKSGVENRRKHEFVNKIEKIAYDIQYRLEHPSAKTVIPEVFGKSVANFLKALDFTTFDNEGNVREGKANKTRAELRLSISNLADNLAKVSIEADYGQLDISADMLEWLKKMSTMLEEKYKAEETFYVRKMNSEELSDLYKLIKSLQTSINQASKFYTNMSSDVESLAYNTIIHLEPLYGKTHNTMLDSVDKLLRWDYAQPITVFDRFGDSGRTLMRMLMQGQKTMADNAEAIENFVQTAYTAEEVNKWREELHKITIQGKTYEVSTAFLMEFHNLLRDPDAKRHILEGGGIRFDDLVIGKKKTRFGDTYVTLEEAAAIDNVLTERQKQVAESLEKFLSETGAAWGNKISMRRFGYHAFGNIENYYPIKTIKAESEYEARQKRANIYALLNKSFTKERNIHADNAIIVGDIFQTFNDHMSEMALYNAWALPVIDLIKWFNYRETQDVENKISEVSVKEALRQAYGKNADEYIRRLLESINSQNSGGLSESIAFKNLRIVNRVAVSANLRVAIQQPFSITRAMELISPKYVKPLVGEAKKNAYNEMVANSSFGKWKSMGYYDVDVSRPLEVKVLKNASFADKITEKSMFLAEAGDNFAWAVLWNACKAEVSEKNKGITNDELIAKTGERFDDIIIRTQVVDSVLTKSQWMRSDSFFHRMTSSFMSESMTSYNTLLRQYDRYSADAARTGKKSALKMNGKPIATTVTVFVLTQLINALVTAPLDAARDDDDYKTFLEKMLEKFKRSALQNLLPTSMMPYIADIVEYAMYGNTDRPDLQLYTKAIDLGKQLKRTIDNYDYFKLHKLINSALSMASSISGIPMSNIARDAIAVWNTVVGNIGNGELKFQTSPDSSSVAYEKMYEAIVNGKTGKATKLYAQMQSNSVSADSINSALTSRVKQDYIDGKIDSGEASRLLKTIAEYTGKELTDDEIYWKIDKWNYEDENGTSDGYAKYDDFFSAVETGNDLRAVIQEYTENGVDKKTLASQITSHFKPIYVGMTRSERASIKGYLLNAYALLGYNRTEKSKDIDNWLK